MAGTFRVSAFSLIELILVIVLTVLLTALLLPTLQRAKSEAQLTVSQSNIRSHAMVMLSYAGDWADRYPYMTDSAREITTIRAAGRVWELRYFDPVNYWTTGLVDAYYEGMAGHPSFHPPNSRRIGYTITSYWYSSTMIAAPSYWDQTTRLEGATQWNPVSVSDVLFPSAKGLLIEGYETLNDAVQGGRHNVTMCDASVRGLQRSELTDPYPFGNGGADVFPGGAGGLTIGVPVLHTVGGVRGLDLSGPQR